MQNSQNLPRKCANLISNSFFNEPQSWEDVHISVKIDERMKINADDEVFAQIKDKSRKAYVKSWKDFKNFNIDIEFEDGHPEEEAIIVYFQHLRLEKKMAMSSIWTHYYYINSVMKRKYGLRPFPGSQWWWRGFRKVLSIRPPYLKRRWAIECDDIKMNQKTRKTTLRLKLWL